MEDDENAEMQVAVSLQSEPGLGNIKKLSLWVSVSWIELFT